MPIYWGCIYISIETWNYTRELSETNEGVRGRNQTNLYGKITKSVFMGRNKTNLYGKITKPVFMGRNKTSLYRKITKPVSMGRNKTNLYLKKQNKFLWEETNPVL